MKDGLDEQAVARIAADLAQAQLGDPRLTERLKRIVERLASAPGEPLPKAMVTAAELEGAYRFMNNDSVSFASLLGAHAEGTAERARQEQGRVLVIHDTTNCTYNHADPDEVGYLPTGKAGVLLHYGLVLGAGRRPLGVIHGEVISREKRSGRGSRKRKVSGGETARWQNKESERWERGVVAAECSLDDVDVIHVADRESDQYPLMAKMVANGERFVFRATHATRRAITADGDSSTVREILESAAGCLEREVPLSSRPPKATPRSAKTHPAREARTARLVFSTVRAELRRPRYAKDLPESTSINIVYIEERDPPAGEKPVTWILYTTEPVDTAEQVAEVVDIYRARWTIEELNKALKTGCVIQERQFESYDALLNILAISLPIACELLALRTLARDTPELPATEFLTAGQLEALRHISHRPVPRKATVQDVLWAIAGLGGHIKSNGPAGWRVLQRGLESFLSFAAGWCAAKGADL